MANSPDPSVRGGRSDSRRFHGPVTAARVTRLPHAIELFAEGPHLAAYIFEVGNPDLEAEAGTGYDAYVGWENEWVHLDMVFFGRASTATSIPETRTE